MARPQVLIGLVGGTVDSGSGSKRWERWRPTVDLARHQDLVFDRFELLSQRRFTTLADRIAADILQMSPETSEVNHHPVEFEDPWSFEEVFDTLFEFAERYPFEPEREDYYVHITTGTHVAQICLFLLTEIRALPGRLIQTSPPNRRTPVHSYRIIDLDLSRYDRIANRFDARRDEALTFLKDGIKTRSGPFNQMMAEIESVAIASSAPMLLTGPTGAGKTRLARRIYALKKARNQVSGPLVEVNCATLRGDQAMSTLFGHRKGAFTGAAKDRPGLLRKANGGLLFLDELGELGLDEQAMLLHAIEAKRFLPVGADTEVESDFQLIAGTHRDLVAEARAGAFREDLLARINLWSWRLPGLTERLEDLEPNLLFELDRFAEREGRRITFSQEARDDFLAFAKGPQAQWRGNFRDLNAAVTRMGTLSPGGRIDRANVAREVERLRRGWGAPGDGPPQADLLTEVLGADAVLELDRFDRVQLADVLRVCVQSPTLSAAGRALFAVSRAKKANPNDADRLRKYLARFDLRFQDLPKPA